MKQKEISEISVDLMIERLQDRIKDTNIDSIKLYAKTKHQKSVEMEHAVLAGALEAHVGFALYDIERALALVTEIKETLKRKP